MISKFDILEKYGRSRKTKEQEKKPGKKGNTKLKQSLFIDTRKALQHNLILQENGYHVVSKSDILKRYGRNRITKEQRKMLGKKETPNSSRGLFADT